MKEYKLIQAGGDDESTLNTVAAEGWTLRLVHSDGSASTYVMEREKALSPYTGPERRRWTGPERRRSILPPDAG